MINKFETMMLSLQTATKKIESFMQNMTASVLMLNVYISHELITSAHSAMSMSSLFSLSKSERASSMSRMKECFFCEEIECQKIRCCQLNIYKTEEKIHVNETNRLWIRLAERSDRLTSFALSRSQKELIDNALCYECIKTEQGWSSNQFASGLTQIWLRYDSTFFSFINILFIYITFFSCHKHISFRPSAVSEHYINRSFCINLLLYS